MWGVYGDDKAAPALAGDLHRSCGVLLCSLRPQQFYNHASAKHRGHSEMMQEIRMERSCCPFLWLTFSSFVLWPRRENKNQHCIAVECIMNYINAALLVNQTLFLSLIGAGIPDIPLIPLPCCISITLAQSPLLPIEQRHLPLSHIWMYSKPKNQSNMRCYKKKFRSTSSFLQDKA